MGIEEGKDDFVGLPVADAKDEIDGVGHGGSGRGRGVVGGVVAVFAHEVLENGTDGRCLVRRRRPKLKGFITKHDTHRHMAKNFFEVHL